MVTSEGTKFIYPSIKHLIYPAIEHLVYPSIKHLIYPFIKHLIYPAIEHLIYPSIKHLIYPSIKHLIYPAIKHLVYPSIKHLIYPSTKHLVYSSINHLIYPAIKHLVYPSIKHLIYPSTKQPQLKWRVRTDRFSRDALFDKLRELLLEWLLIVLLQQAHVVSYVLAHDVLAMNVSVKLLALSVIAGEPLDTTQLLTQLSWDYIQLDNKKLGNNLYIFYMILIVDTILILIILYNPDYWQNQDNIELRDQTRKPLWHKTR